MPCNDCLSVKLEMMKHFERMLWEYSSGQRNHELANVMFIVSGAIRLAEKDPEKGSQLIDEALERVSKFFEGKAA